MRISLCPRTTCRAATEEGPLPSTVGLALGESRGRCSPRWVERAPERILGDIVATIVQVSERQTHHSKSAAGSCWGRAVREPARRPWRLHRAGVPSLTHRANARTTRRAASSDRNPLFLELHRERPAHRSASRGRTLSTISGLVTTTWRFADRDAKPVDELKGDLRMRAGSRRTRTHSGDPQRGREIPIGRASSC